MEELAGRKGRQRKKKRKMLAYLMVFPDAKQESLLFAVCLKMLGQEVGELFAQIGTVVE